MRLGLISKAVLAGTLALAAVGLTAGAAVAAPAGPSPQAENAAGSITSEVSGTFTDALGGLGAVTGTFSPSKFANQNGQIVATGILTASLTDSVGAVLGTTQKTVSMAVELPTGGQPNTRIACDVLNLVLGPLHLDLLGLVVDLNRVVLDIVAQSGAGNLLGNLLCAITNLLNGGLNLPLGFLTQLLNQILAILRL